MACTARSGQLLAGEHLAGRVVRGVDQQQLGARGDRGPQVGGVERPAAGAVGRRMERDGPGHAAGHRDARGVAVVHRLEQHDLVAGVEQGEQRAGQRLGGAGGDQDLVRGVVGQAAEALRVVGDRLAQLGEARAGRVLVGGGADGGPRHVEDLGRAGVVGESLPEVDRARGGRERAHLGEHRRPEALEAGGQVRRPGHGALIQGEAHGAGDDVGLLQADLHAGARRQPLPGAPPTDGVAVEHDGAATVLGVDDDGGEGLALPAAQHPGLGGVEHGALDLRVRRSDAAMRAGSSGSAARSSGAGSAPAASARHTSVPKRSTSRRRGAVTCAYGAPTPPCPGCAGGGAVERRVGRPAQQDARLVEERRRAGIARVEAGDHRAGGGAVGPDDAERRAPAAGAARRPPVVAAAGSAARRRRRRASGPRRTGR